jgi:predicted phage terminase large subunit-like protein
MPVISPQPGPQEKFLSTPADLCIYGGAAGGGKSYGLLLECLRHVSNPRFSATIFRKNSNQIFANGGLWDTAMELLTQAGGKPVKTPKPTFKFPSGAKITFAHLERYTDSLAYQGSQIPLIGFDEMTHFDEATFWYMLSRNRSMCGVRPYVRGTCNPDPDSFVAKLIEWYIDQQTGYAIPERSGVLRYFARVNGELVWGNTVQEVMDQADSINANDVKSFTFIASSLQDNQILMDKDPGYLANLKALPMVEQERLLSGNWKIRPAAGLFFRRDQIGEMLETIPNDVVRWVRGWDLAATDEDEGGDPAYTASVLIGKRKNGRYIIADATNHRLKSDGVRKAMLNTAVADKAKYKRVKIRIPQDPGAAGKMVADSMVKMLAGFNVHAEKVTGSKESRAEPFSAQWQAGNVDILVAPWNETLINQYESFPEGKFKDLVDAGADAFNELESMAFHSGPPKEQSNTKTSYWTR